MYCVYYVIARSRFYSMFSRRMLSRVCVVHSTVPGGGMPRVGAISILNHHANTDVVPCRTKQTNNQPTKGKQVGKQTHHTRSHFGESSQRLGRALRRQVRQPTLYPGCANDILKSPSDVGEQALANSGSRFGRV